MKILAVVAIGAGALFAETVPDSVSVDSAAVAAVTPAVVAAPVTKDSVQCPVSDSAYTALKQNNNNCVTALTVAVNAQMEAKKNAGHDPQAMMMSATSFVTGLGLGALLFWLIFGR